MTLGQRDHIKQAVTLRPELSEVSRGRAFLVEEATAAGFSAERVFDIAVACSEAMANAIEHSPVRGAVVVRALLYPDRLEVEIEGPGEFQAPDRLKERGSRGLGLPLMAKLSDYLALFSGPDGQTFVSLTFYRPGVTPRPHSAFPPSFSNVEQELAAKLVVVNAELRAQADRLSSINSELQAQTEELRVQSERLAASEARYRGLVEQAVDGIFLADQRGCYLDANSAGLRMLGYSLEEIRKMTLTDVLVPDETARLPGQISSLSSGAVVINEWRFRRKDGSTFTGELVGRELPDGRLMGILRDVTERKEAEEALRGSERRLKRSQEIAHLGSWELDLVKDELSWSDEVYRIFGLQPQEFGATYEAFLEHVHPDDRRKVDEAYSGSLLENHDAYEIEHRVLRKDSGEIRYVHEKCQHIRNPEGRVIRSVGMVHDITDRVLMEEALRSNEERTRTFLQVANAISQWTDLSSVLEASLQAVVNASAHTRASIGLWDEGTQQIRMLASSGAEPMSLITAALAEFSHPFQEVVRSGKTATVDCDSLPEEQRGIARLYGTRNGLVVPLIFRERVNGVVLVDDPGEWVPFSDDERLLVEGIAAQAGVAIENARLYEAQKAIADQLQNAIVSMPTEVPGVEFSHLYRSATEEAIVGGDFYDVFSQSDGTIVMLAGDVSGHRRERRPCCHHGEGELGRLHSERRRAVDGLGEREPATPAQGASRVHKRAVRRL